MFVSDAIRVRHYSQKTEKAYIGWVKRFIYFHNKKHPREMGAQEVTTFLTYLAVERNVAPSTQNQANALMLLYRVTCFHQVAVGGNRGQATISEF